MLVAVSLLIQFALLAVMVFSFSEHAETFYWVCILISIAAALAIVGSRMEPAYKIAWIVPILALPIFGGLLYLLFGGIHLNKRTRKRMERLTELQQETMGDGQAVLNALPEGEDSVKVQSRYITRASLFPPHQNTQTWYYPTGEALYARMLTELEQAEHSIFLEYFIIHPGVMWDGILEILERKAAQGVDVRVLYDDIGCLFTLPKHYAKTLQEKGIACKVFNPFRPVISLRLNNRDHRKICVIDGHTAFTGGVNLSDEYANLVRVYGVWKDTAVRLEGEAVRSLTLMFLQMWGMDEREPDTDSYGRYLRVPQRPLPEASGYVLPYADSPLDDERVGESVYLDILSHAERYVRIFTPYLILDETMVMALTFAAKRGVDVELILPHVPDKKFAFALAKGHYRELLDAGVKIYEYTPGFVHAKVFVSDDRKAVVGTINLDYRSLYLHFEDAVYLYDCPCIKDIVADYDATRAQSQVVTHGDLARIPLHTRIAAALLKLVAPLM